MNKISLQCLILFIFLLLQNSFAGKVFNYKIDKTQYLDYFQNRSISLIDLVLSKYIKPKKVVSYKLEVNDLLDKTPDESIKVTRSKIIFYESPDKLLRNKDNFSYLAIRIIANSLSINAGELSLPYYNWLVSGIYRRYIFELNNNSLMPYRSKFPSTHYLVISGKKLNPSKIVNSSLDDSYDIGKEFYSEKAEILLNTISGYKEGRNIISEYLIRSRDIFDIEKPYSLFRQVFEQYQKTNSDKSLIKKLNKKAFYYSVNFYMPASAEFCLQQFSKYEKIPYKTKNDNKIEYCKISEIADKLDLMKNPKLVLDHLMKQLDEDRQYFPYFLNIPVLKFLLHFRELYANLSKIDSKAKKEYNEKSKICLKNFYVGVLKQKRLESHLDELNIKNTAPEKLYSKYMPIIENSEDREKVFWPELNIYLDKMNTQYK